MGMTICTRGLQVLFTLAVAGAAGIPAARANHFWDSPDGAGGLGKKVLVVPIRHQNPPCPINPDPNVCTWIAPTPPVPPRHTPAGWQAILNQAVNDYYLKSTYGLTSFQFTVASDNGDWFDAPHNLNEYSASGSNIVGVSLGQDAMALADPLYDLNEFSRIVVLHNFHRRGGLMETITYANRDWPIVFVLEDQTDALLVAILSHELGHTLGLPDLYGVPGGCQYMGNCGQTAVFGMWDLMAADPPFNHFGGWSKTRAGWIPDLPSRIQTIPYPPASPVAADLVLRNIVEPGLNAARIRLTNEPTFRGYYIECRIPRPGLGDETLPEAGVLISSVDEREPPTTNLCDRPASVASVAPSADICDAAYAPGELYYDSVTGISIAATVMDGSSCAVHLTMSAGALFPDPGIGDHVDFDSPDVWVDGIVNQWGTYGPPAQPVDPTGTPSGPGDPLWIGQPHRIHFRIHNYGTDAAENVVVEVGVRQPITLPLSCGEPGPLQVLGTVTIPLLEPEATAAPFVGYVPWTPVSDAPARIEVRILPHAGELTQANNQAKDAVHFHLAPCADPGNCVTGPILTAIPVGNPCPNSAALLPWLKVVPPGWLFQIDPIGPVIDPGEVIDFQLTAETCVDCLLPESVSTFAEVPVVFGARYGNPLTGEGGDTYETFGGLKGIYLLLPQASVTCFPPNPVVLGDAVTVTGEVQPAVAGSPVALEYTSPSGAVFLQHALTDGGAYADAFTPGEPGSWSVRALWAAEDSHAAAASDPCAFPVDAPCTAPALPVRIDQVTLAGASVGDPVLHLGDPNAYWQVTGYNLYRSESASPRSAWTLLAQDAADQDPGAPGIQWTDRSGAVSPTGIWFYQAAAYNGGCSVEGPW